jgi:hypothetical protein
MGQYLVSTKYAIMSDFRFNGIILWVKYSFNFFLHWKFELILFWCTANEPMEEDVDICDDDAPVTSYPPICIEKETQGRGGKCSNSSSSSDSGSSSSGVYYIFCFYCIFLIEVLVIGSVQYIPYTLLKIILLPFVLGFCFYAFSQYNKS